MAKSRPEMENQPLDGAENRDGFQQIGRRDADTVVVNWLLMSLALVIERLDRIRSPDRGTHPVRSSEDLCLLL